MGYRIYADESGTHGGDWLVIGMLFVPNHAPLHAALCKVKDDLGYFNTSPKIRAKYKETHLAKFRSARDVSVGKGWVDAFLAHECFYRSVVVDWSLWDGKYFGDPFEPSALKKRRAYKKWAEMLLQPELKNEKGEGSFYNAKFYLDKLRVMYGYDVISHLRARFTAKYKGSTPYIAEFQHTNSQRDANQCLQLCDLLTGCLYQSLVPSTRREKNEMRGYLEDSLRPLGIADLTPAFWRHFAQTTLTQRFPKFSAWFWRPTKKGKKGRGKKGGRR